MADVDERRVSRCRRVVELTGCLYTTGVLRDGNDLEVLVTELLVDGLPTWQVEAAPLPGRPRDEEDLLASEVR